MLITTTISRMKFEGVQFTLVNNWFRSETYALLLLRGGSLKSHVVHLCDSGLKNPNVRGSDVYRMFSELLANRRLQFCGV